MNIINSNFSLITENKRMNWSSNNKDQGLDIFIVDAGPAVTPSMDTNDRVKYRKTAASANEAIATIVDTVYATEY